MRATLSLKMLSRNVSLGIETSIVMQLIPSATRNPTLWINWFTAATNFKVECRAVLPTTISYATNFIASVDLLARPDAELLQVGMQRHDLVAMVDNQQVTKPAHPVSEYHPASVYGSDWGACAGLNHNAVIVHAVAMVKIAAD